MNDKTHLIRSIQKLSDSLKRVSRDLDKTLDEAIIGALEDTAEDVKWIMTKCVDNFYDDYDPGYYNRTGSLYKAIYTNITNGRLTYGTHPDLIPPVYRMHPGYIYWLAFEQGYHGGAHTISKDKIEQWGEHPSPGTPTYRTKLGFTQWGDKAEHTKSINSRIELAMWDYKKNKVFQNHFNKNWNYLLTRLLNSSGINDAISYSNSRK